MGRDSVVLSVTFTLSLFCQACGKNSFVGGLGSKSKEADKSAQGKSPSPAEKVTPLQPEINELLLFLPDKNCAASLEGVLKKAPLPIKSANDLRNMKDGEHYELENDIALPENWEPIEITRIPKGDINSKTGDYQESSGLILSGKKHKITGLKINSTQYTELGVFGSLTCAIVSNLSVTDVYIRGGEHVPAATLAAGAHNVVALDIQVENVDIVSQLASGLFSASNGAGAVLRKIAIRNVKLESPYVRATAGGVVSSFTGYADQVNVSDVQISAGKPGEAAASVYVGGAFGGISGVSQIKSTTISNSTIRSPAATSPGANSLSIGGAIGFVDNSAEVKFEGFKSENVKFEVSSSQSCKGSAVGFLSYRNSKGPESVLKYSGDLQSITGCIQGI